MLLSRYSLVGNNLIATFCCQVHGRALNVDEFVQAMRLFESVSMLNSEICTFFQVVDADGSGGITVSEMQEVQRYLGVKAFSTAQVAELVAIIDGDGNSNLEVLPFDSSPMRSNPSLVVIAPKAL